MKWSNPGSFKAGDRVEYIGPRGVVRPARVLSRVWDGDPGYEAYELEVDFGRGFLPDVEVVYAEWLRSPEHHSV